MCLNFKKRPPVSSLETFKTFLKTDGKKFTRQRLTIVERLFKASGHLSADEIYDMLRREGQKISRATVYRTLTIMKQSGLFDEHDFGQKKKYYERMAGREHHDHFYCIRCGKVTEFQEPEIERLQQKVAHRLEFQILYHSHMMFGYCSRCQKKTPLSEKQKAAILSEWRQHLGHKHE